MYFTCQSSGKQHPGWPYSSIFLSEVSLGVGVAREVDSREGDVPQKTSLGTLKRKLAGYFGSKHWVKS